MTDQQGLKDFSLKTADIGIDLLVVNKDNVNVMTEKTIKTLADKIQEVGFVKPIEVIPMEGGRYQILDGHQRVQAGKMIGLTHVPSVILTDEKWSDKDLSDVVSFQLNNIHGKSDSKQMAALYDRMAKKFGHDSVQKVLAVTSKSEWNKVMNSVKKNLKQSDLPEELTKKLAKVEASTPDKFGKYLNKVFKDHADSIQSNFVVFTHGKAEHVLVNCTAKTYELVKKLSEISKSQGVDVNRYMEPMLEKLVGELNGIKQT